MPDFSRFIACATACCFLVFAQNEDGFTAKERISRIRDLSKRDSSAIRSLAPYLSDANREIRLEAVKAIVKIGGEASLDPLVTATHDKDPEIQIKATDGLVNFYLPGYVAKGLTGPVRKGVRGAKSFFNSRNDQVVDLSVTVRPEIAQAVAEEVSGGASMDSRINAARAAGILRSRPAVQALVGCLRARDSELIFESLVALQKIKDPAAGAGVSAAIHDLDERIQVTALETVGILRSQPSAPGVRDCLTHARTIKVRRAALEALASLGVSADRQTFLLFVSDGDPELRAAALEGLGRIREPEDYAVLERAYNEQNADWRVHLAAAFALVCQGKVDGGEFSPLPYLFENLGLKARSDRAAAYLTELVRREDVRKALSPLLTHANKDQKMAMCSILAESQSEDVVPILNSLSRDIDPDVAIAASKGLKALKARQS